MYWRSGCFGGDVHKSILGRTKAYGSVPVKRWLPIGICGFSLDLFAGFLCGSGKVNGQW
jgi:hypothetical protein